MSIDPPDPSISRTRFRATSARALAAIHQRFTARIDSEAITVHGVDFSSAPRRAKPIMVASGLLRLSDARLDVQTLQALPELTGFESWLARTGAGVTGLDLPFGLPREFVVAQDWPLQWTDCIRTFAGFSREQLRERFKSFCDSRPAGAKFAHRQTDRFAGSSPSMKWVNPPVAWMMHAGVPPVVAAGLTIPGMLAQDPGRLALEAYPGLLARSVTRASYKSDSRAKQTDDRRAERQRIVCAVLQGKTRPGLNTRFATGMADALVDDASGDRLDAVLCLVQAAWGVSRREQDFGLACGFDPLEGWITGAGV